MPEPRASVLSPSLLVRATRAKVLPVMLVPVGVGSALAWERTGFFSWARFAVTIAGAAAMHLGANVINDFFDDASGADRAAREDRGAIATGSGLIASGAMTSLATLALAGALFAVALVCGIVLALASGWAVLALGAAGFLLATLYVAPPVAYGYIGRGLGEAGIFVSFGVLPVAGAYYVQAERITGDALWASVVPGLFTTLVLYHHHFLHWRADREAGKMTPVAVLEPERALVLSGVAIAAGYAILAAQVAIGLWPVWALAALLTSVPLGTAWLRARRDHIVQNCLQLLGANLGASVLVGAALSLSLVAEQLR